MEEEIKKLFGSVIETEMAKFEVKPRDIKQALYDMAQAYRPDPNWENYSECHTAQYDTPGHRCAYLFKHAMMHAGLVVDIMLHALRIYSVSNILRCKKDLTLCSLGSGPGTDILALLFLLVDYKPNQCMAYLIDKSIGWSSLFDSIIKELRTKNYSNSKIVSANCFDHMYRKADLLEDIPVNYIKKADIITMVKFVSAAACKKTRPMIEKIFISMKPGAILLFIDNASGGFYEMVEETAKLAGMRLLSDPSKHYEYEEPIFKIEQYGYTSQYKTKVTAAIWRKEVQLPELQCRRSFQTDGQPSAVLHSGAVTESMEDGDFEDGIRFQCAVGPVARYGGVRLESRHSFDEVDHALSDNIKLHSDYKMQEQTNSGPCCLIM